MPSHDDRSAPLAFLDGGSVAGQLIRSIDWARTPSGPDRRLARQPEDDRRRASPFTSPDVPVVGPGSHQFYNDAYLPSFGHGKHPSAMGPAGAPTAGGRYLAHHLAADRRCHGSRESELERGRARVDLSQRADRKRATGPTDILQCSTRSGRRWRRARRLTETTARRAW